MKIATVLNVHGNPDLVLDTVDSIRTYMTEDILVLVDGAANWEGRKARRSDCEVLYRHDPFAGIELPAFRMDGLYHGAPKSPYRNVTLGLKTLSENWHDADWYCYMEFDCLVTSDAFKEDLKAAAGRGVWMVGNDYRRGNYDLPILERLLARPVAESHILLGCCVFLHRDFVRALRACDFFRRFLHATNAFKETVPGFDDQGAYDLAEVVYPTCAIQLGGKVEEFAHWNGLGWSGDAERYPMRFRPDIAGEYPDASIIHPLKECGSTLRRYYREIRNRERKCSTSSNADRQQSA